MNRYLLDEGARLSSERQAIMPARYDEGTMATNHNAATWERGYHNNVMNEMNVLNVMSVLYGLYELYELYVLFVTTCVVCAVCAHHRSSTAAFLSIMVQPLHSLHMSVSGSVRNRVFRAPFRPVSVQPLHRIQMPTCRCMICEKEKRYRQWLDGSTHRVNQIRWIKYIRYIRSDQISTWWPRSFRADIWIPHLYDLYDLYDLYYLYDLAHVAVWEPYYLPDLAHDCRVAYVLHRSCTTYHNGRLGSRWYICRWSVQYRTCTTYHNGRLGSRWSICRRSTCGWYICTSSVWSMWCVDDSHSWTRLYILPFLLPSDNVQHDLQH